MATPVSPITQQPSFDDPAIPILTNAQNIDDTQRDTLYHVFHESKDPNELMQALQPLVVPDQVKSDLYEAKKRHMAAAGPVDKGFQVIDRLGGIDIAEQHPNIAKALLNLAAKEAEDAAAASREAQKAEGKGKEAGDAEKAPRAPLPPRPDGLPHLPSIPEGHYRVLASDGGIHDVPVDKIDVARQEDPLLHVMNP